jgi:hypothetical protein
MSFNTTGNRISYNGNDVTTAFSFPYLFYDNSHLKVILVSSAGVETVQTITTHYTVAGAGVTAGGTVTMLTPPATGEELVILRVVPYSQGLTLVENDPFPSQSVMERLDLNVMMSQQLAGDIGRSLTVSEAEDGIGTLPTVAERASKYAAYDASGNPIASTGAAGTIAVSTFMEAVLGSTSAATLITTAELDDEEAWVTLDMMDDVTQSSMLIGGASDRPEELDLGDGEIAIGDGTDITAEVLNAGIVPYDNSTSGLTATDTQAAIDEVSKVIQQVVATPYTTHATLTVNIPVDDTVPTNSEGTQILTAAITPVTNTNHVRITASGALSIASAGQGVVALFRGSTCIFVQLVDIRGPAVASAWGFSFDDAPASVSEQTYSIRVGANSANVAANGTISAGRLCGGVSACTMELSELRSS